MMSVVPVVEAKAFGDAARDMRAPLALLAQNFEARRLAKLNAGLERVDGEANRSKPAAEISGEIEKTQMQARRRRDLNAFQRAPLFLDSFAAWGLSEFVATLRDFVRFAKRRRRQITRRGRAGSVAAARSKCHSHLLGLRLKTGGR